MLLHHAFLYISLPSLHDCDVKMPRDFTLYGDVNRRQRIFLSFSKLECGPQEINSREIQLQLTFSADLDKRVNVLKNANAFSYSDVFATVAVFGAKTPSVANLGVAFTDLYMQYRYRQSLQNTGTALTSLLMRASRLKHLNTVIARV